MKNYLEKTYKLLNTKCRLWIFYLGQLIKVNDLEKSFVDEKIIEYCIVVLETMNNNKWPSDQLDIESTKNVSKIKTNARIFVGIMNIGNSTLILIIACFMNEVLQVILNLEDISSVLSHKDFYKCVNIRNKSGKVITEFLSIFKDKWNDEQIKTLNLRKF